MNEFPVQEIKGIRLGVQPHGIVMRQQMGLQEGVGTIGWKNIYEWYNTPDFILVNFKVKIQKAKNNKVLISYLSAWILKLLVQHIRTHLKESVGEPKPCNSRFCKSLLMEVFIKLK